MPCYSLLLRCSSVTSEFFPLRFMFRLFCRDDNCEHRLTRLEPSVSLVPCFTVCHHLAANVSIAILPKPGIQ